METLLAVLHVVAAVFVVGPMAILPMTAMRAVRAGQGGQVEVLARSTFVFTLISIAVPVIGFGILPFSTHGTKVTTPWILISLVLYVVALALSLFAVVPSLRSAAEHLQDPQAQELRAADYKRISMVSGIVAVLMVLIVVLMVWKP